MRTVLLFLATALFAACSTHDRATLSAARAAGISPRTMEKLEHRGSLTPEDIIELKRRGVPDSVPLRQLDRDGVDYVIQRDEVKKMRSAGVSPEVTGATIAASDRYVRGRYAPPPPPGWWGWDYGWTPPPYYYRDPWWWPRTSISLGYAWGGGYRCW